MYLKTIKNGEGKKCKYPQMAITQHNLINWQYELGKYETLKDENT